MYVRVSRNSSVFLVIFPVRAGVLAKGITAMEDQSHLDRKYFIDPDVYNCPFCNRRHVSYSIQSSYVFNWSNTKQCVVLFVKCHSCDKESMHLSYDEIRDKHPINLYRMNSFAPNIDIDSHIFYSVPTSFFVIDNRIPKEIRELVSEAEGCLKMNFLTGASACARKAIYELTVNEHAQGTDYESKIKSLKAKHPGIDPVLFDGLAHIQDMTSDKVHEQSWPSWDSPHLKLILETLKAVLHEIYVLPDEKKERSKNVQALRANVMKKPKTKPRSSGTQA